MSSTPATPSVAEAIPAVGGAVLVSYYDGKHVLHNRVAHVLSVAILAGLAMPVLCVAFPTDPADPRKLGSPRWSEGFERRAGVVHYTHPDAVAGRASIVWGYAGQEETFPTLIKPEGDGSNPIFERNVLELAKPPEPDIHQVSAVQHGKAPEGVSAPALTSEVTAPTSPAPAPPATGATVTAQEPEPAS